MPPPPTLLDLLREQLNLTGTKKGCDRGQCGPCTILVNGRRINSCLALEKSHRSRGKSGRMKSFDYVRPESVSDAIAAASLPGSAYLAGSTNLLDLMKGGVSRPDRLVDVTRMPGLDRIEPLRSGTPRESACGAFRSGSTTS